MRFRSARFIVASFAASCVAMLAVGTPLLAADKPTVVTDKPTGVYAAGEKVTFTVKGMGYTSLDYVVKHNGAKEMARGKVDLSSGEAQVQATLDAPGWVLFSLTVPQEGAEKPVTVNGGAAFDWKKLEPAAPAPDDFSTFWKDQLAASDKVPLNVKLTEADSGNPNVSYYYFEADHSDGTKIRGQFARPKREGKYPANLILQYAGVYPLQKAWVLDRAANGWIALNIIAHDLPIDEPADFYKEQAKGPLNNYTAIGMTSRDTSYFRRMYVACYRAATWLGEQPEWDGKTFMATGGSQGGCQAIVTGMLYPKTTAILVGVPAGCDTLSYTAGRSVGWPYWKPNADKSKDSAAAMETSRYFDVTNFAAHVTCPTLVSVGLIDQTCPPTAVMSMFNQLKGPKELVILPLGAHQEANGSHKAYYGRAGAWINELKNGNPPPVKAD